MTRNRDEDEYAASELRRQEEEAKKLRLQGQNPDGRPTDGDFIAEAKDWAGELISGQTATGRILVSTSTVVDSVYICKDISTLLRC